MIDQIKQLIAVASGKGDVGKSTVASNVEPASRLPVMHPQRSPG